MNETVNKVLNWRFMDESLTNWFIFLGVLIAMNLTWKFILSALKD